MTKLNRFRGFSLIELLIAVAIIGILASIAYPSYTDFVARSNRTEAQRELLRVANLEEQFYVDNRVYTADMKALGLSKDPFKTDSGHYSIDAVVSNNTSFTLTATAQGGQATTDSSCKTLSITEAGQKTPISCWD